MVRWGHLIILKFFRQKVKEGRMDGCTNAPSCVCYDQREDYSRGSTWDIYMLTGRLFLVGDLNYNLRIDVGDLEILKSNFGKTGHPLVGDNNRDGRVDIFDFNILVEMWRK